MKLPSVVAATCLGALADVGSASVTLRSHRGSSLVARGDPDASDLLSFVRLSAKEAEDAASRNAQVPEALTTGLEKMMIRIQSDPASLGGVAGIVKPMVEKLLGQVTASHNDAIKALDAAIDDIKHCKTGRHKKGDKDTTGLEAQYEKIKEKAESCNQGATAAKAESANCAQSADIMDDTIDAKCKKLKKKPGPNAHGDMCDPGPADDLLTWVERMAESWEAQYNEHLKLVWECGNMTQKSATQHSDCDKTAAKAGDTNKQCDTLEDEMKQAVCGLKQGLELGCTDYEGCYKRQVEDFNKLKATTEMEVKTRKAQWRMLNRLLCLVNAYNFDTGKVDKDKMDACAKKGVTPTDNLDMTYPEAPPIKSCTATLPEGIDPKVVASCDV